MTRSSISLRAVAIALTMSLWLAAGCGETPKPANSDADTRDAGDQASAKGDGPAEIVPDEPPMQSEPKPAAEAGPRPVTPAELQELISQNSGKLVLVDFWATWCVPCRQQYPHTVELSKKHATDLVVYAVSMDTREPEFLAQVKKFYQEHNSGNVQPLISAVGGLQEASAEFEITGGGLPHYKLYGRDGKLIKAFGNGDPDAPLDPAAIDKAIAKALGEESMSG